VPTLQLLKYTEGEAAGNVSVRFCHYGHAGNFRRSPLMMSPDEIDMMRDALHETPELQELVEEVVRLQLRVADLVRFIESEEGEAP